VEAEFAAVVALAATAAGVGARINDFVDLRRERGDGE
jgi:hypothetical protein